MRNKHCLLTGLVGCVLFLSSPHAAEPETVRVRVSVKRVLNDRGSLLRGGSSTRKLWRRRETLKGPRAAIVRTRSTATSGSGPRAPMLLIPATVHRKELSANTMGSSCATSTSYVAAPAPLLVRTCGVRTGISFPPPRDGSSAVYGWRVEPRLGSLCRRKFLGYSADKPYDAERIEAERSLLYPGLLIRLLMRRPGPTPR